MAKVKKTKRKVSLVQAKAKQCAAKAKGSIRKSNTAKKPSPQKPSGSKGTPQKPSGKTAPPKKKKKPAVRLVVNKKRPSGTSKGTSKTPSPKKKMSGTGKSGGTSKMPSQPSTPRPAPPKKTGIKPLAGCRKKGLKNVKAGELMVTQTGGTREPLPAGAICYTWSEVHGELWIGYVTGLNTVAGRPTRQVKYFGVGKYKIIIFLYAFKSLT